MNNQSNIVNASYSSINIVEYSELNTVGDIYEPCFEEDEFAELDRIFTARKNKERRKI